jgi:membrane protein
MALPLSWSELATRTWRESLDDDVLGLAAQLAYYFFLALFPAILFFLAIASFFPLGNLTDDIGRVLQPVASPQVLQLIQEQMLRLANNESGGLLTFGVVGALWSSSAAIVSISGALNKAYDIEESRPWWKVRLLAIGLTIGCALFVLFAFALVLLGPSAATWLGNATGWGAPFRWAWLVIQWPLSFALVATAIALIYYFGPDAEQDWTWITPGAIVATVLWLLVSLAFKFYVTNFTDYNAAYGAIGGVIVLLLWFYVSGVAVLTGAELNAEIEHASPHGKGPGVKTPAGRLMLGSRAQRAFLERLPAVGDLDAVILDVDGTLIDSNGAHAESWADALREHGVERTADQVRPLIGMGADKLLPEIAGIDPDSSKGRDIAARKKTLFTARLPHLAPTPGARALIEQLRERGTRVVVATSADDVEMNALLERAGVADLIQHRASKDDAARSKPDPDIVAAALGRAGAPVGRVAMIGDTPYDIEAARRVGVATIALRCGGHWKDEDLSGAVAILDDPESLSAVWQQRATSA